MRESSIAQYITYDRLTELQLYRTPWSSRLHLH